MQACIEIALLDLTYGKSHSVTQWKGGRTSRSFDWSTAEKNEPARYSETSAHFQQTGRRHIPQHISLQEIICLVSLNCETLLIMCTLKNALAALERRPFSFKHFKKLTN